MERNIKKIGFLNFVILLLAGGISIILARYCHSLSGQVAAVFFGIGAFVALVSFFQSGLEEKERLEKLEFDEIAREKNADKIAGKSEEIAAKIINGPVEKFRKENALLTQAFVMDGKTPVQDVIAAAAKDAGKSITLKNYVRFQLGEGIEKEASDFAAEVAAAAGV